MEENAQSRRWSDVYGSSGVHPTNRSSASAEPYGAPRNFSLVSDRRDSTASHVTADTDRQSGGHTPSGRFSGDADIGQLPRFRTLRGSRLTLPASEPRVKKVSFLTGSTSAGALPLSCTATTQTLGADGSGEDLQEEESATNPLASRGSVAVTSPTVRNAHRDPQRFPGDGSSSSWDFVFHSTAPPIEKTQVANSAPPLLPKFYRNPSDVDDSVRLDSAASSVVRDSSSKENSDDIVFYGRPSALLAASPAPETRSGSSENAASSNKTTSDPPSVPLRGGTSPEPARLRRL